ncbi:hypothetical protein QE370_000451 [Aeromicrobium sp. SORGH_AS981]|uniref:hypothetical protein n=1 Tax=Aeromicrobium sp. SORGH_AS_0981 TaxID=3041802 RepID=UPI0028607F96|nr:hypothetical protein [Aeromicrobium sp. SORGH_AS_0981]MDR6117267.1 hypothetical protein [Aeromicrobium sp. SORGH_AS_0981]
MSDQKLTGADLEKALTDRGLPITGTADEKRAAVAEYDAAHSPAPTAGDGDGGAGGGEQTPTPTPTSTTLDSHTDAPSTTAPGDGPADTTDPNEIASTVSPDKAAAAQAGHGTVNGVVKTGEVATAQVPPKEDQRVETYTSTKPDGTKVLVTHNLDTGATTATPVD